MAERTPGPWLIEPDLPAPYMEHAQIFGPPPPNSRASSGHLIATVGNMAPEMQDQWEADAQFIVRAANSHDELVAALKALDAVFDFGEHIANGDAGFRDASAVNAAFDQARAALAKAGEL